jgi:hypothetical protein
MYKKIKVMLEKIQELLDAGYSLQKITSETYHMRENGEDMIYFGWLNKNQGDKDCLVPMPIAKQKQYKHFFGITAGNVLPKYTIYIYQNRIEFLSKVKIHNTEEGGKKFNITNLF